jgi:hypothetical protein
MSLSGLPLFPNGDDLTSLSKKPRRVRGAHAAKKMKSVFSGDLCVGENTSRPANVRIVRF